MWGGHAAMPSIGNPQHHLHALLPWCVQSNNFSILLYCRHMADQNDIMQLSDNEINAYLDSDDSPPPQFSRATLRVEAVRRALAGSAKALADEKDKSTELEASLRRRRYLQTQRSCAMDYLRTRALYMTP